ncbi:MAG: ATP-binding protein [Methylococcales bacterium]|nr:ATP-binding protein [Methylococcales bacterium]
MFIHNYRFNPLPKQRYAFDLALTKERIIEERLISYPNGKETLLYQRQHLATGDEYTFGKKLEGGKDLHELWRKSTGAQVLFIVQAVANSSEELTQLQSPLGWLRSGFLIISGSMQIWVDMAQNLAKKSHYTAQEISNFLQNIDVPVTNVRVEVEPTFSTFPNLNPLNPIEKNKMVLTHQTALGEAEFDFYEESEGTKNLIGFWLPWKYQYHCPEQVLIVDELNSSLHPEIVISLVAKHLKNESPAQLIFTTHDTHLMDAKLLRRDQFWLTERDANGATQLRSIHDFEGRASEDLEKRYYEGRYRGLPFVRRS